MVCDKAKPYKPTAYFNHIMDIANLITAGFPFGQDDLTHTEWLDAGMIRQLMSIPDIEE